MKIFNTIQRCLLLSKRIAKRRRTIDRRMLKFGEEVGEFYAASLIYDGGKGSRLGKAGKRRHLLEEGCDVLIVLLSILFLHGFKISEISKMMNEKMDKWERRLDKGVSRL